MKTLFIVFALLPMSIAAQDINLEEWHTKWDNSQEYLMELVDLADSLDLDYRPSPDQMSLRGQLMHIAGNMYFLSSRYLGYTPEGFDQEEVTDRLKEEGLSLEQIKSELKLAFDFARSAVQSLKRKQWKEKVDFFAGPKTRRVIAWLLQDHVSHHRGQVIVYLRMMGVGELPRFRGW